VHAAARCRYAWDGCDSRGGIIRSAVAQADDIVRDCRLPDDGIARGRELAETARSRRPLPMYLKCADAESPVPSFSTSMFTGADCSRGMRGRCVSRMAV